VRLWIKAQAKAGPLTRRRFRRLRFALFDRDGLRRLGRRRGVTLQQANGNGDGDVSDDRLPFFELPRQNRADDLDALCLASE
jgi:hypothetical protein